MRKRTIAIIAVAATIATGLAVYGISEVTNPSKGPTEGPVRLLATISVPGRPLDLFDGSRVDPSSGHYYLADDSNAGVDVIDTRTNRFIERIGDFVGASAKTHDEGGPNGVAAVPELNQLWVGDGHSQVRVVDTATMQASIIDTINTGGKMRVNSLSYDPEDGVILTANDADAPAFVSFVSAHSHALLGRLAVPEAAHGLEQSVWDGATHSFYLAVPLVSGLGAQLQSLAAGRGLRGEILRIDPQTRAITGRIVTQGCINTGLEHGPGHNLLFGCHQSNVTQVLDLGSLRIMGIDVVGGTDEVTYDPARHRYYVAAAHNHAGPVLGVIDADTNRWLQNVQTAGDAHSVAADPASGHILVAMPPNTLAFDNDPARGFNCRRGCVAVYGVK